MSLAAIRIAGEAANKIVVAFRSARFSHVAIVLTAVAVSLPSLQAGLFDDDLWQRSFVLDHLSGARTDAWWQMFGLPKAGALPGLIYGGYLPWWTSPHFSLSFFRPLAVATHYLDYWLWPQTPWLMHLQNTLWYGVLCLLVLNFYRRVLTGHAVAALAGLLYAVDDTQLEAVAWLAARNSIITALFCVLTLVLLDEETRVRSRLCTALAALSLSLAHLAGEGAIAVWAYIIGGVMFLPRASARYTLASIAPCAAVSVGFSLITRGLSYTVVGSGAYIDPFLRPIEFAHAVLERLPRLLRAQFGPPTWLSQLAERSAWHSAYAITCAVGWLLVGAFAVRLLWSRPQLRALLAGALGCAALACAARPEPRLLLMAGIGAHALHAELLVALLQMLPRSRGLERLGAMLTLTSIGLQHLLLAPIGSFTVPESYRQRHRARMASALQMEVGPNDADRVVAILDAPSYFDALSICTYRLELWPRAWRSLHILGSSEQPVTLTRETPNRLILASAHGYLLERTSQQARSPDEPFFAGQTTLLDGLAVVVETTTRSGRPDRVRLELPPDHDQRLSFLSWDPARRTFERIVLPAVGKRVQL